MKIKNINVTETIEKAREMLKDTKNVPVEFVTLWYCNVVSVLSKIKVFR